MSIATQDNTDIIEGEFEVETSTALAQLNASEIDIQIATANRYPRSVARFKLQVTELATLDEETASSMFYKLPRGGKFIEGPSVRLAEVAAASYKHLRFGSRIISVDDRFITAQGFCYDLENNIASAVEVRRRITDKYGKRFNDDMIQVTGNAASSIALRNAIFKIIPMAYIKPAYEKAKLTALGENKTMAQRREAMLTYWKKAGATEAQVFAVLGVSGVEDLGNEELLTLHGLATAVKTGEMSLETAMTPLEKETSAKASTSSVNEKLKGKKGKADEAASTDQDQQ
jgi:hypothetical protein